MPARFALYERLARVLSDAFLLDDASGEGIEAVQMIRKGQVLGITRKNLHGQAFPAVDFVAP